MAVTSMANSSIQTTRKREVLAVGLGRDLPSNTGLGVLVHLVRVMMGEMRR
jgi:hypothetical protein